MSYRIKKGERVNRAVVRIAREQMVKAIHDTHNGEWSVHQRIHEIRKRCKKIRGLIRIVRPVFSDYNAENRWFRDAARDFSDIRDLTGVIETCDTLTDAFHDEPVDKIISPVAGQLEQWRNERMKAITDLDVRLDAFVAKMEDAKQRCEHWSLDAAGFDAIHGGLIKTYGRARDAMAEAYRCMTPAAFHEWRKRVKYHRYHMRLLRDVWPGVIKARRDEAKQLSDWLGDDHDLAVLRDTIRGRPRLFGRDRDIEPALAMIDRRQMELRAQSRCLGAQLFAENEKRFGKRVEAYWDAWRSRKKTVTAEVEKLRAETSGGL